MCRCSTSKLIMIGDRYLTDVVYGNRHGMLTIRPTPLTTAGEPFAVRMVIVAFPSVVPVPHTCVTSANPNKM